MVILTDSSCMTCSSSEVVLHAALQTQGRAAVCDFSRSMKAPATTG